MSEQYDRIYPSHGIPELPAQFVKKVLDNWCKVCSGEIKGYPEEKHGTIVQSYDAEDCGFYCN